MSIARSTFVVTALALVSSILTFTNQLILAYYFGAHVDMDAYLIAISLPITLCGLSSGILSNQLIPVLLREEHKQGSTDQLINAFAVGFGGMTAAMAIAGTFASGFLTRHFHANSDLSHQLLAAELSRIAWWWLPLNALSSVYTAGLHIRQRFACAAIFASGPVAATMIICLVAHSFWGVRSIAAGQLLGYGVMTVGLRISLGRLRSGHDWKGLRRVAARTPLAAAALLIFIVYPFSDAFWGSHAGSSAVSYLGYSQRLLVGFATLTVVGATTVLFPHLARQAAAGADDLFKENLAKSLRAIFVCLIPAVIILSIFAMPVSQLLFQRGAFQVADASAMAALLPLMLLGMLAMSCMGIVFKALFAQDFVVVAAVISTAGGISYFVLSGLLAAPLGIRGFGVAYAFTWWCALIWSLRFLWRGVSWLDLLASNSRFAASLLANSAIIAAIAWCGRLFLPLAAAPEHWLRAAVVGGAATVAAVIYVLLGSRLLRITELQVITKEGMGLFRGLRHGQ